MPWTSNSKMPWIVLLFITFLFNSPNVSAQRNTDSLESDVPVVQEDSTALIKEKLEQFKQMEESALKEWYGMVKRFLELIKPDDRILEVVIDYIQGTLHFEIPSSILEIAKKNSVFLVMVSLGLVYVIAMLLAGIFFLCCRFCGRCGAKKTQRQTRHLNCWRTTHKFCLVLMIAFLVVPITCICIINEHMKQSFPVIRTNASQVFIILADFANSTEKEVNELSEHQLDVMITNLQDPENFKQKFAIPLQEDVFNSVNSENLDYVKNIVFWVLAVKENYTSLSTDTSLSAAFDDLKNVMNNLLEEAERLRRDCRANGGEMCDIGVEQLSIDTLDVDAAHAEAKKVLKKLTDFDSAALKNVIAQIQNNTILSDIITEKIKNLEKLADELKPQQNDLLEKVKSEVKVYADELRHIALFGKTNVDNALAEVGGYEIYRWWTMLGIAIVLGIPVAFLILGLLCGCCGYKKGRHPSKRSSTSNCGGICFIAAVYFFFLTSSVLMLFTIALFVVGGNIQTFVCTPLYEENFRVLDRVMEKLEVSYPFLKHVVPSKLLNDCHDGVSIFDALNLTQMFNDSGENLIRSEIQNKLKKENTESDIRRAIAQETQKIQDHLDNFASTLNLTEVKDLKKLQSSLEEVKDNILSIREQVELALTHNTSPDIVKDLQLINDSSILLWEKISAFEKSLNNFSSVLHNIYNEADGYAEKISGIKVDLKNVESKMPDFIHNRLIQYIMGAVSTDIVEKLSDTGHCERIWLAFDMGRTVVCKFLVYPVNGFWFGLGWSLFFIIPTIIFAVKLSRHYLRMKYDDDAYIDSREAMPLDEMSRSKPFSYTNAGNMSWMPQFGQSQNYMVHPTSGNVARHFDYK